MKVPIGSLRFGQIAFGDFGNPGNVNCHSLKAEVIRRAYPEPVLSKVEGPATQFRWPFCVAFQAARLPLLGFGSTIPRI